MNKAGLIKRIEASRAELETAIGRLSEAQLMQITDNGWAAKDHQGGCGNFVGYQITKAWQTFAISLSTRE